jgi:hypothetical protein
MKLKDADLALTLRAGGYAAERVIEAHARFNDHLRRAWVGRRP